MSGGPGKSAVSGYRPGASLSAAEANQMMALMHAGQWGPLEEMARRAVKRHPRHFFGWKVLGMVLAATRRPEEAVQSFLRAAEFAPGDAMIFNNLGGLLNDLRRHSEAEPYLRRALALQPGLAMALSNLGSTLSALGRKEEAVEALRAVVALEPHSADAHAALGRLLVDMGRREEAIVCFRQALAIDPRQAEIWDRLGAAQSNLRRDDEAEASLKQAILLKPDRVEGHIAMAEHLDMRGERQLAEICARRAVELDPKSAPAHTMLGKILWNLHRFDEAESSLREALSLAPGDLVIRNARANVLHDLGRVSEAMAEAEAIAREAREDGDLRGAIARLISGTRYRDDLGSDELNRRWRDYHAILARDAEPLPAAPRNRREKIRVGYLSSDLRHHSIARNLLPVVRAHDRARFEVSFYANVQVEDEVTKEFRALADGWCDIRPLSDLEAARRIQADEVDILVSVAGHFDDNRPAICSLRPAPVQIAIHDVSTSCIPGIDYIVADRHLIPRDSPEFFVERPLRLPNFFIANPLADMPDVAESVPAGGVMFSSFNNPTKIAPSVLALWARILAALPDARLLLKYVNYYGNESLRERCIRALTEAGASPGQIEFVTANETLPEHLERYGAIDIALDCFPFCGSTTSFEALSMGVPVVTWPWDRMVSRWTLSMLRTIGLDELVARSGDEYVAIALDLARDRAAWRARRREIRERIRDSALCDPARWTRHLERLYRAVWRRHLAAGPPS